jgi:hypothetical protein
MKQTSLFPSVHARENTASNQEFLNENRPRLQSQCERVLAMLQAGQRLTVREAMIEHNINSLPRRIKDLRESGYRIYGERGDDLCVQYFMR